MRFKGIISTDRAVWFTYRTIILQDEDFKRLTMRKIFKKNQKKIKVFHFFLIIQELYIDDYCHYIVKGMSAGSDPKAPGGEQTGKINPR